MNVTTKPAIVVGVSGSRASEAALRWAADEADRVNGQLRIVRAWERPVRAHYARPAPAGEPQLAQEHARRGLAATMRNIIGAGPRAETTMEVVDGMAERVLADHSDGADLLVLGSASGVMAGRSIGPVIRACLSRAQCPVVVVSPQNLRRRDEAKAAAEPAASVDKDLLVAIGAAPAPRAED